MKVLIADDDKIIDAALSAVFKKRGWQVTVAYDTMQTLMLAKQQPIPDVILLDLKMPGGTGEMALERLKASTLTAAIPVVIVSGTEDPEAPKRVEDLGAVGFVKKPVDAEALALSVEKFLARKQGG